MLATSLLYIRMFHNSDATQVDHWVSRCVNHVFMHFMDIIVFGTHSQKSFGQSDTGEVFPSLTRTTVSYTKTLAYFSLYCVCEARHLTHAGNSWVSASPSHNLVKFVESCLICEVRMKSYIMYV